MIKIMYHSNLEWFVSGWIFGKDARPYALDADLVKLFIMFFILKLFFFPSFLKDKTDEEKQQYVGSELVNRSSNSIIK